MHAPPLDEDARLIPDNDPLPAPFGALAPTAGPCAVALARHVGATAMVMTVDPPPITSARFSFNNAAAPFPQVHLAAAAAGPADGELMIETDGGNLGASHIVIGTAARDA